MVHPPPDSPDSEQMEKLSLNMQFISFSELSPPLWLPNMKSAQGPRDVQDRAATEREGEEESIPQEPGPRLREA